MEDILHNLIEMFSVNIDAIALSISMAIATGLVLGLKSLFALAAKLAKKTPTGVDDDIVEKAKTAFKDKSKDI